MGKSTTFKAKIVDERPLAFKFRYEDRYFWVPKSQISDPDVATLEVGDDEEIEIPNWLADKLDLL